MIIFAFIATIFVGYLGAVVGNDLMNGFVELGSIFAIATMGAFILSAIRKKHENN